MKELTAILIALILMITTMPVEGIRISSIDDTYIGEEVTISGVVVAISSNVETSNVYTYVPGDTSILTIDDGSGMIQVCGGTRLFSFTAGERIMVSGIYAGEGIIYADKLSSYVELGCEDVSVAELKEFPEYYYDRSVCVKAKVKQIEPTPGKTKLKVEDDTGMINVEYGGEIDVRVNEEVIAEGKFYRNRIYAVSVRAVEQKTVQSSPEQSETPTPAPTLTPAPTPTPLPTPASNTGLSSLLLYLLLICVSVIIVVFSFLKLKGRRG